MRKLLFCLITPALLLAACAGSSDPSAGDDSKAALTAALEALSDSQGLTLDFSLESTPDQLVALAEDSGDELTEEDADKILNSSLSISGSEGDDAEDTSDDSAQILATIAGEEDFELRVVEQVLYLRADVAGLLDTFGEDSAQVDQLITQTKGQPGFEWVEPAVNGEWVSIANPEQFMGPAASQAGAQQEQVVNDVTKAIRDNAEVTSEGEEDEGTHLVAVVPLRDTFEAIADDLGEMTGGMPGMEVPSATDVPDEDLTVDFWVSDGTLTQMQVDFVQIARIEGDEVPEGVEEFALQVTFEEFDGGIEAVADAVEIDPQAVGQALGSMMQGFGGAGGGGAGGGLPPGFDCSQLEGAPPEVIELYEKECPELQ
jgi:hypothetical protein